MNIKPSDIKQRKRERRKERRKETKKVNTDWAEVWRERKISLSKQQWTLLFQLSLA